MNFTIFSSNTQQVSTTTVYPNRHDVTDKQTAIAAFTNDHVCAEYKNNYRSSNNFIRSDVICMDCDNDFSEDEEDWVDVEDFKKEFKTFNYVLVPSRNHMKIKGNKVARPRFHAYFPISEIKSAVKYKALKEDVAKCYSFFDANALDAARFLYGHNISEIVWHDGGVNIDFMCGNENVPGTIPEGSRNSTMSVYGSTVLKRFGDTPEAYDAFLEKAKKCDPPLDDEELGKIWKSATTFFHTEIETDPNYIPADKYNPDGLKPEDFSDMGQAKLLSIECEDQLRYTPGTKYLAYDGKVWLENESKALGIVEDFLDLQLADAELKLRKATEALVGTGIDELVVKKGGRALEKIITNQVKEYKAYLAALEYHKFVIKGRYEPRVKAAMTLLKPKVLLSESDLDKNEFLINCPDGTYDLRKGMDGFKEHDPKDYLTRITDYAPGDEGMDLWLETLDKIFEGDDELLEYVHMVVGLAAIGTVNMEAMIISYGSGSNGKSTFWNSIARVLGTYSGMISAETLTVKGRGNAKNEIAEAKGKRLIVAAELKDSEQLNTAMVKQLCSTDKVGGEKKFKDPFSYVPSHTLVLYTNHLPEVSSTDRGTWRRLNVIPFMATLESKNKNYTEVLLRLAGEAIMKWIIEGAKKVIAADYELKTPKCVQEAIEEYRQENDWMGNYLDEYYEADKTAYTSSNDMYRLYRELCYETGDTPHSTNAFYKELKSRGFIRVKKGNVRCIKGLKKKPDDKVADDFLI